MRPSQLGCRFVPMTTTELDCWYFHWFDGTVPHGTKRKIFRLCQNIENNVEKTKNIPPLLQTIGDKILIKNTSVDLFMDIFLYVWPILLACVSFGGFPFPGQGPTEIYPTEPSAPTFRGSQSTCFLSAIAQHIFTSYLEPKCAEPSISFSGTVFYAVAHRVTKK